MSEKSVILNKIISGGAMILAFLVPLFFLPFTYDFYEFNKNVLLVVFVSVMLLAWLLKMALEKKVTFRRTAFDLPILVFAGAFILSTILSSPNKWAPFWIPGGTGTILGLTILYFVMTNVIRDTQYVRRVIQALIISTTILSLITIYQFIGLVESLIASGSPWAFLRLKSWTPTGGLLTLVTFLVVALTIIGAQIYRGWKTKQNGSMVKWFNGLIALLVAGGLGFSTYQLFTTAKPLLLPYSTSWAIAVEAFKNGKIFLFGVGPTNFLDAFSQFRPLSYNLTPLWMIRFGSSSNFYLQLVTTIGLVGLLSFGYLIWKIIKTRPLSIIHYPLFIILIILLFLPINFLLLFVFFVLLALLALELPTKEYSESSKIVPWAIFIPVLLFVVACLFFTGRIYAAEVYFKRSLNNLTQNDGTRAYDNQIKAIKLNPYYDIYRLSYSQTNLLLADALASKTSISDQDRQNITTLIQQSISEAKTAVSLNKNKIINWENLANIYRQLLNFAQGADQWTIATLNQAIKLDPVNPNLRLTLGGIYYALQNFDEAIRFFQQAVDIKPNFANGYYNLSAAYREKGDFQKAHEMMQITLSLVPTMSEDYDKARGELEELAKRLPTATTEATPSAQPPEEEIPSEQPLIEPQPLPSPVIEPPIELPEEPAGL